MRESIMRMVVALVSAGICGCGADTIEAAGSTESPEAVDVARPADEVPRAPESSPARETGPSFEDVSDVPWTETPMVLRVSEPFTGDLDRMREREVVRVLVSYSRTNFFLAEGKLRGFEYELFRELDESLQRSRPPGEPPLNIAFLPVPFDELIPALLEGRGDVAAASLTITPEREELVTFTEPYLTGVEEILVSHVGAPAVTSWEDLAGQDVHVATGTVYQNDLERKNEQLVAAGQEPMRIVTGGRGLKTEDMLELVHSGAFQYTLADRFVAEIWSSILDGLRLETDLVARTGGKIAWAVRPGSPQLKAMLDGFASKNRKGTLIGNVLFKRYYDQRRWISNPLLDTEHSKLAPFLDALKRHAQAFGFDWRLIAAQAYQESQLDPNTVSRSGAVGLMQLLPSTAEDMGVTDLRNPERNLYAGVKYMDWLRRNFFDEPQLAKDAQLDFCLAAYNAGPSRVRRWRAAAPARSLDPDRWFGNVELLALEDVGLQPVQYVGNINKYFVLYTLAMDDIALHDRARSELDASRER